MTHPHGVEVASWPRVQWAPDADVQRAACALVASVTALAVLRVWMAVAEWPAFVVAYGVAHGLDLGTGPGMVTAELHTPGQVGATVFDLAVVLLLVAATAMLVTGRPAARPVALVASGLSAAGATSSLAYPAPWWFVVATVLMAIQALLAAALMHRATPWTPP